MKLILTFSGVLIFVPGCHRWSHTAHAVRINIAYPTVLLFYQARDRSHLPSVKESLLSLHSLSAPGSSLRWHITEPMKVLLCQKRLLLHSAPLPWEWSHPYYTAFRDAILQAAVSIGTALSPYDSCYANKDCSPTVLLFHQLGDWPSRHSAAFRDAILQAAVSIGTALSPYDSCCANKDCSPTVLLFHQLGDWPYQHSAAFHDAILQAAISIGTALSPYDSCYAKKDCSPTVLLFHQPWDWPHLPSAAFRDAILLFLSPPSQKYPMAQHWAHRTHAVPTKIAPPQYFSSTS